MKSDDGMGRAGLSVKTSNTIFILAFSLWTKSVLEIWRRDSIDEVIEEAYCSMFVHEEWQKFLVVEMCICVFPHVN